MRVTRAGFFVRLHARIHRDEGGFTIVEMMVALSILAVALVSLAYTASISFTYSARARQKQDATAAANQAIEQVRALAVSNLAAGMSTSDLGGDGNITTCAEGPNGCFNVNGVLEPLVASSSAATDTPLNPHVKDDVKVGVTTFTRKVYLTQVVSGGRVVPGELRVSVLLSWKGEPTSALSSIRMDSLIDTTSLCPSGVLHRFAGPCQSYLKGKASIPAPVVSITATTFPGLTPGDRMEVYGPGAGSEMEVEQTAAVSGNTITSGGTYLLNGTTKPAVPCGLVATLSAAGLTLPYSSAPLTANDTYCPVASPLKLPVNPAAGSSYITLTKSAVDLPSIANTISTTTATVTNTCNSQADGFACAYDQIHQQSQTVALLQGYTSPAPGTSLGTCPLVQVDGVAANSTTFINRDLAFPSSDKLAVTATRYLPTITIGCIPTSVLPAAMAAWNLSSDREYPAGTKAGYWIRFSGWTETITVEAGDGASPTTTTTRSGSIRYWNGSGYTAYTVPVPTIAGTVPLPASIATGMVQLPGTKVCTTLTPGAPTIPIPAMSTSTSGSPVVVSALKSAPPPTVPDLAFTIAWGTSSCSTAGLVLTISTDLGTATAGATYLAGS